MLNSFFFKYILNISQDILIYNPKTRPTAKQLIEQHPYFTCQSIDHLEKPIQNVIDRAIRLQTETMKQIVI